MRLCTTPIGLVAVLVTAALPGCISYRLDRLPPAPTLPPPALTDARPSVVYSVTTVAGADFASNKNFPMINAAQPGDEVAAMLLRSGWFRSVQQAGEGREADVRLDVVLSVRGNDVVVLAAVCTLMIIPMWRTVNWDLTAEVHARDGRSQRYDLQDSARDIFWLPILLGMSFRPWGEAYSEVRDNMYRTLLARMHEDGLLAASTAPP